MGFWDDYSREIGWTPGQAISPIISAFTEDVDSSSYRSVSGPSLDDIMAQHNSAMREAAFRDIAMRNQMPPVQQVIERHHYHEVPAFESRVNKQKYYSPELHETEKYRREQERENEIERQREWREGEKRLKKIDELTQSIDGFTKKMSWLENELKDINKLKNNLNSVTDIYAEADSNEAEDILKRAREYDSVVLDFGDSVVIRSPIYVNLGDRGVKQFKVNVRDSVLNRCSFFEKMGNKLFRRKQKVDNWKTMREPVYVKPIDSFERNFSEVPPYAKILQSVSPKNDVAPIGVRTVNNARKVVDMPFYGNSPHNIRFAGGPAMESEKWYDSMDKVDQITGIESELSNYRNEIGRIRKQVNDM